MVTLLSFCFSFFSFPLSVLFFFISVHFSLIPLCLYFLLPLLFSFVIHFSYFFSSFFFFFHSSSFHFRFPLSFRPSLIFLSLLFFFPFFLSPPSFSVSSLETFCSFLDYQTSEKYLMTPRSSTHTKLIKTLLLKHKRRSRNIFESIFPGELKVKSLIFQLFSFVPFSSPSRVI